MPAKRPYNPDQFLILEILKLIQKLQIAETPTLANSVSKYAAATVKKALTSMSEEGYIQVFHRGCKVKFENYAWELAPRGIETLEKLESKKGMLMKARLEALTNGWFEGYAELFFGFRRELERSNKKRSYFYNSYYRIKENSIVYVYDHHETNEWIECRVLGLTENNQMVAVQIAEKIIENEKGKKEKAKVETQIIIPIDVDQPIKIHPDNLQNIGLTVAWESYLHQQQKEELTTTPDPEPTPTPQSTPKLPSKPTPTPEPVEPVSPAPTQKETPERKPVNNLPDDFPSVEDWKEFVEDDDGPFTGVDFDKLDKKD